MAHRPTTAIFVATAVPLIAWGCPLGINAQEPPSPFHVQVYKRIGEQWVVQPELAYQSSDPLRALQYATRVNIVSGLTATTNARFNVSTCNRWDYAKDENGQKGSLSKRVGDQWIEIKGGRQYAKFKEITRTAEYVELFDQTRSLTLRLYATEARWKTPDHEEWFILPFLLEMTLDPVEKEVGTPPRPASDITVVPEKFAL